VYIILFHKFLCFNVNIYGTLPIILMHREYYHAQVIKACANLRGRQYSNQIVRKCHTGKTRKKLLNNKFYLNERPYISSQVSLESMSRTQ